MTKSSLALLALICLTIIISTASGLGQSNIFGVFRKRRRTLDGIQDKRVQVASRRGFAGPHGEMLTVKEFEALQAEKAKESSSFLGQFFHIFDRLKA